MPRLTVRSEAELDALEAASWYEGERANLGTEFLDELRTTFSRIDKGPQRFPVVFRDVRRAILHRFPFAIASLDGVTLSFSLGWLAYAIVMFGVCLLACVVPARRALRVDPISALRAD